MTSATFLLSCFLFHFLNIRKLRLLEVLLATKLWNAPWKGAESDFQWMNKRERERERERERKKFG